MCRIYIACLASYNSGILHGEWIDVSDVDTMQEEINQILRTSPCPNVEVEHDGAMVASAEEWAIHDYELGDFKIGEYESLENIERIGQIMDELDGDDLEAFMAWFNNQGSNYELDDSSVDSFREVYQGVFKSLEDYAYDWIEQTGGLEGCPDHLKNYIDFAAMGRDFELGGDIWTYEAGYDRLFVFSNH